MGCRKVLAGLLSLGLVTGCGGSPSSPSKVASTSNPATESAVMTTVSQAMSQLAFAARPTGDFSSNTFTTPCSGGGSIVMTMSAPAPQQGNVFRSSWRTDFLGCRNQSVVLNGDPYLETSIDFSFSTPGGPAGDSVSTLKTTGGIRIENAGVVGRVQFNCTTTLTILMVNGTPQVSFSSSGTTTFEQPLGSTPVVRSCGPA